MIWVALRATITVAMVSAKDKFIIHKGSLWREKNAIWMKKHIYQRLVSLPLDKVAEF